jgi:hypothetical protein
MSAWGLIVGQFGEAVMRSPMPAARPGHKVCTKCNRELPHAGFYARPGTAGERLQSRCRDCQKEASLKRWHAKRGSKR